MSGTYIIYETTKKGKEYFGHDDSLIFEGEYLNGKRNGKGKEYNRAGNVKFEGEYLNGKRKGKGKEYNSEYYCLIFEGEYLNGLKWNGKGYNNHNNIVYRLNNGNGYIIDYYNNGK